MAPSRGLRPGSGSGGSSWTSVSPSNYAFDGTELTVEFGTVHADTTTAVRVAGSRVRVNNGSVSVLEPTVDGHDLDSEFKVTSWGNDSYIGVGGTSYGELVHYTYNESWPDASERTTFTENNQQLALPGAEAGDTARVATLPVSVATAGDVAIQVDEPTTTEPTFSVSPGAGAGQSVSYTLENAQHGTDYILYSYTHEVVRASGTASSPLTLADDDSDELLGFQVDDSGGSTSDGTGGSGGGVIGGGTGGGPVRVSASSTFFIVSAAAVLAGIWWLSRTFGSGAIRTRTLFIAELALVGLLALETLSAGSLAGTVAAGIGAGIQQAFPLLALGGIAAVLLWLRNRGKPDRVINFRLGGGKR